MLGRGSRRRSKKSNQIGKNYEQSEGGSPRRNHREKTVGNVGSQEYLGLISSGGESRPVELDNQVKAMFQSYLRTEGVPLEIIQCARNMLVGQVAKFMSAVLHQHVSIRNKSKFVNVRDMSEVIEKLGSKYRNKIVATIIMGSTQGKKHQVHEQATKRVV